MTSNDSNHRSTAGVTALTNLTTSQLSIWTGQKLYPGLPLYNMALAFDLRGPVEVDHFRRAFQALVDSTDALRTVFDENHGIPGQRVLPAMPYEVRVFDFSREAEPCVAARSWISERCVEPFGLDHCLFESSL